MQNRSSMLGLLTGAAILSALISMSFGNTSAYAADGDSLSLQQSLALAASGAPNVETAARELAQAESAYRELTGGFLPQVTLNGGVAADETAGSSQSGFGIYDPGAALTVGVAVPLSELIGKQSAASERAEYDVYAAERALAHAREDAKLYALETYLEAVKSENRVDLSRRSMENTERLVRRTRLRYELGEATRLEVMEAEQKMSDGELGAAQADNALQEAYAALNQALGRPVGAAVDISPVREASFDAEAGLGALPDLAADMETAFEHRVDVLLAREQLELFDRVQALTPEPGKPFVTFSAGYEWEDAFVAVRRTQAGSGSGSGQGGSGVAGWELAVDGTIERTIDIGGASSAPSGGGSGGSATDPRGWNASVEVTWPLYTGGRSEETRRQNDLQREALVAAVDQAEEGARLDVRSRRSALELAVRTMDIREKALEQALESLRVIRLQHEAGAVTDSDLLNAEIAALQAEFDADAARYDIWMAAARYDRALGLPVFGAADGVTRDEEGER